MTSRTLFCNHVNTLVDKYCSPSWDEKKPVNTLKNLTISALSEAIRSQQISAETLQELPPLIQKKISLRAKTFPEWLMTNGSTDKKMAKKLLTRWNFERTPHDVGTDKEIFLKRILYLTLSQADQQERNALILHKRQLSKINNRVYSFINSLERMQFRISNMMLSPAALIIMSIMMTATTYLGIYYVYPRVLLYLKNYYIFLFSPLNILGKFMGKFSPIGLILLWNIAKRIQKFWYFMAAFSALLWAPVALPSLLFSEVSNPIITFISNRLLLAEQAMRNWRENKEMSEVEQIWLKSFPRQIP